MNNIEEELMNLCVKAYELNEVPIAAVVVNNGEIIGKGYNQRIHKKDVTAHAEIIAIKEAEKKLNDWRLNNCDLYVTLEPCNMCKEIIKESRIENVYYYINKDSYKKGYYKTNFCSYDFDEHNVFTDKYKNILKSFFDSKCNR